MTEVRTTSSTGGEKGMKPERYDLIPVEALASVARLYGEGAKKYSEHNWRKGYEWSKSYAALNRHLAEFWKGVDIDPETGQPHLAAVVFHAFTLLTFMEEQRDFDDRYSTTEAQRLSEEQREEMLADLRRQLTEPGAPTNVILHQWPNRGKLIDFPNA
jgi:alpha-ketoglutarate-dependent taurine dioxygenase